MRLRSLVFAAIAYSAIAFSLTGPALFGNGSLMPEAFLDADLLYGRLGEAAAMRPFEDSWPVAGDLGREQAFAEGLYQGRVDTWNPWAAAGTPLWAEQGGPFFPTKLIHYLFP